MAKDYCIQTHKMFVKTGMRGVEIWKTFLEIGTEYSVVDVKRSHDLCKRFGLKVKECFYNSQQIAIDNSDPDLIYCEGYAHALIPCEHGWLLDSKTGQIVDPTWAARTHTMTKFSEQGDYFGIPIPTEIILNTWRKKHQSRQLLWTYIETLINGEGLEC